MSAAAMYMILYGTMPDELFWPLFCVPLALIVAISVDWAADLWRVK